MHKLLYPRQIWQETVDPRLRLRLHAKFRIDQFIPSPMNRDTPQILPFFLTLAYCGIVHWRRTDVMSDSKGPFTHYITRRGRGGGYYIYLARRALE